MKYHRHYEASLEISASADAIFDRLDDPAVLGQHMAKPTPMMMGMRMTYRLDSSQGRAVGSVIGMSGSMMGIEMSVEEVVTERAPPRRKVWETRGHPRLLVLDGYRMGFEVASAAAGSNLRVFIDYNRPASLLGRVLGLLLGRVYARWCVRRMLDDAQRHFAATKDADG